MGISHGDAAPGGALGVGGFEFDDASPQFPAASNILRTRSPFGCGGTPRVLISSLGRSPSALVEVRAMRAVLRARFGPLQRQVVLESMRRGIPK